MPVNSSADSPISAHSVVVASKDQVSCDLDGEAAILNLASGTYYGLTAVGASVWNLIQEPRQVDAVRDALLDEYDVDAARCEQDLLVLLRQMADEKLIEVRSGASS